MHDARDEPTLRDGPGIVEDPPSSDRHGEMPDPFPACSSYRRDPSPSPRHLNRLKCPPSREELRRYDAPLRASCALRPALCVESHGPLPTPPCFPPQRPGSRRNHHQPPPRPKTSPLSARGDPLSPHDADSLSARIPPRFLPPLPPGFHTPQIPLSLPKLIYLSSPPFPGSAPRAPLQLPRPPPTPPPLPQCHAPPRPLTPPSPRASPSLSTCVNPRYPPPTPVAPKPTTTTLRLYLFSNLRHLHKPLPE